ncbi:C2 domain-containing protein 5 isoform X14 [Macaca nemestrina]|uniref:C2 domain-containing protein 5 n=4 Tax=Cercopithecinae TaxID=9528 RepID=A0A2K5KMV7_CERAT|nr:C2 domain-containing protein 5 isoform X12 [Papio anubis]XP_011757325.1 C2 domain-containing protein 5 isoform X12 [Macaca nemestrina]XP_011830148.1 PREDICTED: C2 domain-containing protein 5 isoform X2 [Mandrillus leucophaeus]XP_011913724.1 PREDICTED: C2 domain-containing protein 5 isoform X17 [Cercocebus atys]XP_017746025.1 PREDICTED: C2 domain-containing protein 5 isoform X7 [Rhinopithecus bieti]XP_025258530.1 C2 domain-containing protein 5 isoform X2 [Theropithecus gelada]XP_050606054.1
MPGKLKVKIVAGRHLPVMDRASDLTDAFVEVKFGNTTFKTDVYLKSLNPQWNSEWFKFEVDDEDLQDEPLQITVLDHDTYSANDAIGKVYIDIDPLLYSEAATVISGWFPIYDTIHGIRGEINVVVKVDLFNDLNRFRQSSCGVKFFCTTSIPKCYRAVIIHGFVEELVVNEDPEYQWIDRIRTPRASNEARQRLISLMSGELQRKIGLKVLEMRGNAVVGYLQCFDLEGESGLVVRAIGTACTLDKLSSPAAFLPACNSPSKEMKESPLVHPPSHGCRSTHNSPIHTATGSRLTQNFSVSVPTLIYTGMGSGSAGKEGGPFKALLRQQTQSALEQRGGSPHRFCRRREFPFFTLTAFPPGFLVHVGGVVSARSVKLLDRIHNPDEPETRDAWWAEIRQEIKSHAKALGCHAVVGYSESTSICEEVCILSASGTAAVLNPRFLQDGTVEGCLEQRLEENLSTRCGFCHIPYDELNMPFPAHLTYCYNCRKQKVPDVLFTTIDLPTDATVIGKGCLIQARLCRLKKKAQAEANATAISNLLPFMEYEVHTQLMNKLKLKGMNALFGLRIQITVGENMLMGLASATGVYLAALPTPGGIQIAGKTPNDGSYEQHISHMQKKINDTIAKNKELYEINPPEISEEIIGSPIPEPRQRSRLLRSQSESSDEVTELDLSHGKKDAFVLEIDDTDAMEDVHSLLTDVPPPSGFYSCNTEIMPGINNWTSEIQMFTSVRVIRLSSLNLTNQALNKNFNDLCENLLKSLYFKLRSMIPCCLCHVNFTVSLPEDELIQVTVTAVAITFDKNQALQTTKTPVEKSLQRASTDNEELLQFPLELCSDSLPSHPFPPVKEHLESASSNSGIPAAQRATSVDYSSFADRCSSWIELIKLKAQTIRRGSIKTTVTVEKASPVGDGNFRNRSAPPCANSTVGVVKMTPLSFIPGAKITKYLGIINMFFIRETTSLREEGGVSGFLHAFIAEVFAMVRAHVAALGGNAVVSYIMKQCVFMENPNKNQAQCLINVSGDAVVFVRESDLEVVSSQQPTTNCQSSCTEGEVTT